MKKKQKAVPEEKVVRVNLGCGANLLPGWINIDGYIATESPDFLHADVRDIPLESNSVDYLLCDNVLEHIAMHDVPVVVYEIRRILKKGGRAVIIVPEFRDALNQWLKIDHDKVFNPFLYKYVSEVIYGTQVHEGEYHRTPMSAGLLNYTLQMCGFRNYKMIIHPAFGDAPNYPGCASIGQKLRQAEIVCDITK